MSAGAGALALKKAVYYELRSRHLDVKIAGTQDKFVLKRGNIVLCIGFARELGRQAILRFQQEDGEVLSLFHTVSRFNRGSGNWRELNPMMVIALADEIPIL